MMKHAPVKPGPIGELGEDARKFVAAPAREPKTTHNKFLFINESATPKAGKKLGHRKDIRSHVRRHVVTDRRKPVVEKPSKGPHSSPTNATRAKIIKPWHTSLAPGEGARAWIEETFESPEADYQDSSITVIQIGSPLAQDPELESYDDLFGTADESLTICHACTSHPAPLSADPGDVEPSYCLSCSTNTIVDRIDRVETTRQLAKRPPALLTRNTASIAWNAPSPSSILSAGRTDPFSPFVGAGSRVHELVDHSMTCVLPGIFAENGRTESSISRTWYLGLAHPLLFHTLAFAGSIHLDFLRYGEIFPNSPVIISHKLTVIRVLNELLDDPKTAAMQEMALFTILMLASHGTMDMSHASSNPFDSPLKKTGWLNVYGTFVHMPDHLGAVMELLTLRGGLEKLEWRGMAQLCVGGDIISSTRNLTKTMLAPMKEADERIHALVRWATRLQRPAMQSIASGFACHLDHGISSDMISVFSQAGAMTKAIQHYVDGESDGLSLTAVSSTRGDVQQLIMNLPSTIDIPNMSFPYIYEACRLTGIIYGIAVIFPIPNAYDVFKQLVERLQTAIEMSRIESFGAAFAGPYLWMLILGGIAALDKPERCWFVGQLLAFSRTTGVRDWSAVQTVVGEFLWLESACEPGGRKLWTEVLELGNVADMLN